MKEQSWNDCLNNNTAKMISPDISRAKSLRETAYERIDVAADINEKNCNFVFEDYYSSLLELLQAKAFEAGFNILNHVCSGLYIRDILEKDDLYLVFEDIRYKRNSLTYYGNRMDFETAKSSVNDCKKLMEELK